MFLSCASFDLLPFSKKTDQDVCRGAVVQELGDEVQVGNQSSLENDRHVRCVEELDRVGSLLTAVFLVLDRKIDAPSLEVDDDNEDQNSSQKIRQVGKVLTVKRLTECTNLIITGDEKVEKSNNSTLELSTTTGVDSSGTEGFPDDRFTNVGSDEERNTRSKSISFLKELVKSKDNETGTEELGNDQDCISSTDRTEITVHSTNNVSNGFTSCDQNTKEFLGTRKQGAIFLDIVVDLNDTRTSQKLHNKTRSDNRTDPELHESTTVGSKDNSHPVERIRGFGTLNTIDWNLTAHQEDEQSNSSPKKLLAEGNLDKRC